MRWEEEQPFWFTEAWKARVPKEMLEGIAVMTLEDDEDAAEHASTMATITEVLITWGDSVSDMINLALLLKTGSRYGPIMLGTLVFANLLQAVATYFWQRQGVLATASALLGLKPLVDGFRLVFGIESKGKFDASINFALTRVVETGLESIPQASCLPLQIIFRRSVGVSPHRLCCKL